MRPIRRPLSLEMPDIHRAAGMVISAMSFADRLADMSAELALLRAELVTLRDHNAMLREGITALKAEFEPEQKRCDRFFELAAWAASQAGGGPFNHIEQMLIRRAVDEWRMRRHAAPTVSLVDTPGVTDHDDDPKPAA
jgi:hypothetical protein